MRIALAAGMVVAVLALSGCGTDNGPPVVATPPAAPPTAHHEPAAATRAWADQVVIDALAADKAARAGGQDEKSVFAAVDAAVNKDIEAFVRQGASADEAVAGLGIARDDPRDTDVMKQIFTQDIVIVQQPAPGHCPGCKG